MATVPKQIFIIGTSHTLQSGVATSFNSDRKNPYTENQVEQFRCDIKNICQTKSIQCIAEESSPDSLELYEVTSTVAAEVAEELSIDHKHVDLSFSERQSIGIDDRWTIPMKIVIKFMPMGGENLRDAINETLVSPARERVMVVRMLAIDSWPKLFICGSNHVNNINELVNGIGQEFVQASILNDDYDFEDIAP